MLTMQEAAANSTLSELGEAAMDYARKGWRVFPLAPRGKIPITKNGLKDATVDPDQIRHWWTQTPDANIGFATGSGIYVLDVDGQTGEDNLTLLTVEHGPLPATRECRTGKGRHFYFASKKKLGNTAGRLGTNIDTRGDGGYVILPPSIHPDGGKYEWAVEGPEFMLPDWLDDKLEKKKGQYEFVLRDHRRKSENSYGDFHPYIAAFFDNKCNALSTAPSGTRNHRLNDLAFECGRIAQGGLASPIAMEMGVKAAARNAGLDESEIEKTWRSGYESGWLAAPFVLPDDPDPDGYGANKGDPGYSQTLKKREPNPSRLIITPLSKVKRDHIEFMWGFRLVQQGVNLLVGDGGLGKSALALHIARAVTDGIPLPDDQGQSIRGSAMMVTYEDPPDLVKMRAKVLNIDLDKFYVIEGYMDEDDRKMSFGREQVEDLLAALEDPAYHDVRLLIIDPWGRYLDDDDNREKLIRRAIAPLEELAQRRNVTILILGHTNKSQEYSSAEHRIAGHSAFKNVARSVIMVGNLKGNTNAVAHVKHNWSKPSPACVYTWNPDKSWGNGECPLEWGEVQDIDADELFQPRIRTKMEKAEAWLRQQLITGEPMDVDELKEVAAEENIASWSTIEKAAKKMDLEHSTQGNQYGGNRKTTWRIRGIGLHRPEPSAEPADERDDSDEHGQRDPVPAPPPLPADHDESLARFVEGFGLGEDDYQDEPF